jgi:hypothetical protein
VVFWNATCSLEHGCQCLRRTYCLHIQVTSAALKMETADPSETFSPVYQITRLPMPEYRNLDARRYENLKSHQYLKTMRRGISVRMPAGYGTGPGTVLTRPWDPCILISPASKWPQHEGENSPPSSAEVKDGGAILPLIYLHGVVRN